MASKFSVFIPDLRNHGQSPHAAVHTYPAMSDDLLEFMEEHDIQNPVLIAHSMGGKAAMQFTLEHPEMVRKLAVIDISLRKYPERSIHTSVITHMLTLDLDALGTRSAVEKELLLRVPDASIRLFMLKNLYYKTHGRLAWRLNIDAINHSIDSLFDGISLPGTYDGPTLFVRGDQSDYIPNEDEGLILRSFPRAVIKTIPGASHWVHADAPGELCHLLSDFLEKECNWQPGLE